MAFAPYADLLWLETKSPNLEQAKYFSSKVREPYPGKYVTLFFNGPTINKLTYFPDGLYTT